jgi:hypothetical protein
VFLGSRRQLRFGFGDDAESLAVGVFAFAGLPSTFLVAAIELLLCARNIDLLGLESVGGKDRYAIGKHFNKAPTDVVA